MKKTLLITSLFISLFFISCSSDDDAPKQEEQATIKSYTNITLGSIDKNEEIGSLFSSELGSIVKKSMITNDNTAKIDIAYVGDRGMQFFESPDKLSDNNLGAIENATTTAYINYIEGNDDITFSTEMFDKLVESSELDKITITNDNESFPSTGTPRIVLFQNAAGKKGVIKITSITPGKTGSITFDLKVQK